MATPKVTDVTVPVNGRSAVGFICSKTHTPQFTITTVSPALVVTLTLPERIDASDVRFARDLAATAALYAQAVERAQGGSPSVATEAAS
jgi:hypothetical protein